MKNKLILLAIIGLLASCQYDAKETHSKGEFQIEFLFEHEGCKMYRFYDGRTVYWSDCSGKTELEYNTQSGKISQHHYEQTLTTK